MFTKILIANRGEIACRVARTAHRMGIATVAVYSDADRDAPHVKLCHEAVHIGPAPAAESYLVAEKIIAAAKATGAQAIHPGYGFLSENAEFADALEAAGLVFIGPTAETIRAMGSKSAAKDLMEAAGVPTTPGYQGEDQSLETFRAECKRIGYPVLLKATAGGGGKGMRLVEQESELEAALAAAQREAQSAFGDDRFLVEKYVARARHLEVQVFGDGKGDVVHMFERDCSVQRRHQKIIEEAPAPNLPKKVRAALLKAGVDAAKAVNYRGAGTVEFLYDPSAKSGGVYFMEMNTRLQVEHPVSEEITGQDFVEWQLRIAAGEGLPLTQHEITETGHAFESRLYAENADKGFTPSIGTLTTLRLPDALARIDSGVAEGQTITPFYDPMIAKIITHGPSRDAALGQMRLALSETCVDGLETNARFLHALASDTDFAAGDVSTRYIDEHGETLFVGDDVPQAVLAVAALQLDYAARAGGHPMAHGFRLNRPAKRVFWVDGGAGPTLLRLSDNGPGGFTLETETGTTAADRRAGNAEAATLETFAFNAHEVSDGQTVLEVDGQRFTASSARTADKLRIWIGARWWDVALPDVLSGAGADQAAGGSLTADMPGVVTLLKVEPGAQVKAGDALMVMEAMKMEHTINAPSDGTVTALRFGVGDQVKEGDLLVAFEAAE